MESANTICKYQSIIFPRSNELATSLAIIDFRPSRLDAKLFWKCTERAKTGARTKSGEGRDEVREKRGLNVLRISSSRRDVASVTKKRESVLGNAVRTLYFLFARQKRHGATSQTRQNPVAALTYSSLVVILLETFARVERHPLNCRRGMSTMIRNFWTRS